ncbi:MAG: molybdopterin molybdotransferase MoeA [Croceibacterium sp.]
MTPPLSLAEAQAIVLDEADPLLGERVDLQDANGRYASEAVVSRRTQPAADMSAMDGYAMRGGDLAGPWRVVGESAAGRPYGGDLHQGEAVRISTGALMPADAGAVLLQENARRDGEQLALNGEGEPTTRHIRRAGFDFRAGDALIEAGTRIGPAQIALAMMGGHSQLAVHALPALAVLDSGDELASDPAACAAHQIPASNGAMLAAMAAPYARVVRRIGPVADQLDALLAAFEQAGEADVIVTSGGASVGEHDLIRPALEAWGATIGFWRVAIRPGKPLLVARKGRQWVIGLPGNPVSSYVTAFLFVLPLLRALAGAREPLPELFDMELLTDLPAGGDRLEFVRAHQVGGKVTPTNERDSSALRALSASNGLIRLEIGAPVARRGDKVGVYWLENGGIA